MDLEERVKLLEEKIGKLTYPIDPNSQGTIENTRFRSVKALQFRGGLPVFTSSRNDQRIQAEIYISNLGGSPKISVYIGGVEYNWTSD